MRDDDLHAYACVVWLVGVKVNKQGTVDKYYTLGSLLSI